jgi:hypothetical protein
MLNRRERRLAVISRGFRAGRLMLETNQHLPDWITAFATAITAVAAIFAGAVAFVSYKREGRAPMPVIEPHFSWVRPKRGRFVYLEITARNQLYETITLQKIVIKKPRKMTFCAVVQDEKQTIQPTQLREMELDWSLAPIGETRTWPSHSSMGPRIERLDVDRQHIYLSPPVGWNGGMIEVQLLILSKALTIRPRRITIRRQVSAAPIMQTEENANSQA